MVPTMEWQIINLLAVFLVTGIGADYMFLACDGWEIAKTLFNDKGNKPSIQRTGYFLFDFTGTICTAGGVTVLCFVTLGLLSKLIALRQFGIFMTLVIVFLVLMVIFVLVPFMIFMDRFNQRLSPCGCQSRSGTFTKTKIAEHDAED